jgi:hypothetical protein
MTEYHTVYKGPEGETTQWEDIQRRLGNLPPKAAVWKPDAYQPEEEEVKSKDWLDKKDNDELSDLEDELADDRFLEEYRYAQQVLRSYLPSIAAGPDCMQRNSSDSFPEVEYCDAGAQS